MIRELRLAYCVTLLCRVLEVTASGYYAWVKRPLSTRQREEMRLEVEILASHKRTRQTYGPERLQRDLSDNGVIVGVHRIKRILEARPALPPKTEVQGHDEFAAFSASGGEPSGSEVCGIRA